MGKYLESKKDKEKGFNKSEYQYSDTNTNTSTNEDAAPINLVDYMNSLHIDIYDQWWYRASHVIEAMGYRWQGRNSLTGVPKTEIKYIKSTRSLYVSKPYALRLLLLSKSKKVNKVIISFCKEVCQTSESAQDHINANYHQNNKPTEYSRGDKCDPFVALEWGSRC